MLELTFRVGEQWNLFSGLALLQRENCAMHILLETFLKSASYEEQEEY